MLSCFFFFKQKTAYEMRISDGSSVVCSSELPFGTPFMKPLKLHTDRLFPAEPRTRDIARALHATVRDLPIVSPHGHTDPRWFAYDDPFPNPSELLIVPDHYVFRMLMSQGVKLRSEAHTSELQSLMRN